MPFTYDHSMITCTADGQPESFGYEGEGNMEACRISDKYIRQERKRINFMYLSEWQRDQKGKESMEAQSTAIVARQNHSRGRRSDHSGNFPRFKPGTRGSNMHIFGHPHANLSPGLMAPTRPLMPRGIRGPVNQFGVPLGMPTPIQSEEALMQEQMMMSNHALHLGVNGHPSFNADVPPYPLFGMDYFGARPRGMMHLQPNGPGMVPPINCFGAFENTNRVQRPIFGVRRNVGRGSCAHLGGGGGSFARNRSGRPAAWSSRLFGMQAVGRERGRSQPEPLFRGHEQSINIQRVQFSAEEGLGHEVPLIDVNNVDNHKMKQDGRKTWNPMESENIASSKNTNVTQQESNSGSIERNGPPSASLSFVKPYSISNMTKSSIEDGGKTAVSNMLQASTNMIKLGVPVQRSRALSVGGLCEGTPLSVVIEAFEKQGKIMVVFPRPLLASALCRRCIVDACLSVDVSQLRYNCLL